MNDDFLMLKTDLITVYRLRTLSHWYTQKQQLLSIADRKNLNEGVNVLLLIMCGLLDWQERNWSTKRVTRKQPKKIIDKGNTRTARSLDMRKNRQY